MRVRTSSILAVLFLGLLGTTPALAVSNRIFMSTNGNNASDCANPLTPCLTFAGALAQVNPGGEVIAEATGGYGPLNITQAVTISGPPGVVIYSGLSVTVNAPGDTVVLRGLTIDGAGATGMGVNVTAVGTLFVESCVITGFAGASVSAGNALYFGSPGALFVKDSTIRSNGNVAILVRPATGTANASIDHCRLEGNGSGVVVDVNTTTTIRDSVASGNVTGFQAQFGGELNIENCLCANNQFGVVSDGALIRVSSTTITDNSTGLAVGSASSLLTRGNNTVQGNVTKGAFTGGFAAD